MMLTRPIRFTRFGIYYVLFALGVGAAAINTGNNLLYLILGILLSFIIISGFLSDSALWGLSTEWSPAGSLYAGQATLFDCRVTKGGFPGVTITITSQWQGHFSRRSYVPWVAAHHTTLAHLDFIPQKRGKLTLDYCRYATRFPFGLFEKSHLDRASSEWTVYPRLYPLPDDIPMKEGKESPATLAQRQGSGALPYMVRDYRPGDSVRHMHWKMSAKRGRWIVKEMEEESGQGDFFKIESWPSLSADEMELFISFIASLAFSFYKKLQPVGLAMPGAFFEPPQSRQELHRLFDYLALVNPSEPVRSQTALPLEWRGQAIDLVSLWFSWGKTHVR
jgi:uncharacterized protein (DUF58 family)